MKKELIPRHAKGSPVNTNPLPEMPVNTNPVPKKDKKIENLGIRPTPGFMTSPRGNTKGYLNMNPYKK